MNALPKHSDFAEQVGTVFSAGAGGAGVTDAPTVEFRLEVAEPAVDVGAFSRFALEFTSAVVPGADGAPGEALPQRTYLLGHPVLGEHPIFLVPIASDGLRARYEAVFNVTKECDG